MSDQTDARQQAAYARFVKQQTRLDKLLGKRAERLKAMKERYGLRDAGQGLEGPGDGNDSPAADQGGDSGA